MPPCNQILSSETSDTKYLQFFLALLMRVYGKLRTLKKYTNFVFANLLQLKNTNLCHFCLRVLDTHGPTIGRDEK
jgi:hypothetical protein